MAVITDITEQAHDKLRLNIYVDSRFYCGLKLETVMKNRLKKGQEIELERLNEIQLESERSDALDKALNYISKTMKTEKDIRGYLKKKGYVSDVEEYVVSKMKDYGYINDELYGETYAKSLSSSAGKMLIEQKLIAKGVPSDIAKKAAAENENEEEAARIVFDKYMRNKEFTKENLYKAFRYLMGKGFSYEAAKSAIKRAGAEDEDL